MPRDQQQRSEDDDRPGDEEDLVPSALVGEECAEQHGFTLRIRWSGWEYRADVVVSAGGWQTRGSPPLIPEYVLREQVEKVITAIRPAVQADEGDIALIEVDEESGVVTVELMGACVTCPASTQTLKAGIERIMKDRVEGVTEVVEINALGMSESAVSL